MMENVLYLTLELLQGEHRSNKGNKYDTQKENQ